MKLGPVGAELFLVDSRTDRQIERSLVVHFLQFCEKALKRTKSVIEV